MHSMVHGKKSTGRMGTGKMGTGKMGTGKKGTSEKLGNKGTNGKNGIICKLLLLLFNQHLNYSICILLRLFVAQFTWKMRNCCM